MGREIRRVPLNFVFPLDGTDYFDTAYDQHKLTCAKCSADEDPTPEEECPYDAPEVPAGEGWQLWQTVSNGPITPVFATSQELVDYISQPVPREERTPWAPEAYPESPGAKGWKREVAEKFVTEQGWIPSGGGVDGKMDTTEELVDRHTK